MARPFNTLLHGSYCEHIQLDTVTVRSAVTTRETEAQHGRVSGSPTLIAGSTIWVLAKFGASCMNALACPEPPPSAHRRLAHTRIHGSSRRRHSAYPEVEPPQMCIQ